MNVRMPGRPKVQRRREVGEAPKGSKLRQGWPQSWMKLMWEYNTKCQRTEAKKKQNGYIRRAAIQAEATQLRGTKELYSLAQATGFI